jgi:hypothetical protein
MAQFDTHNPLWVSVGYARRTVQNAWLGQCRGDSYISQLIRLGTQGTHSHSMMFRRTNGDLDVLETREGCGGRSRPVDYHFSRPSRIDCFSPNAGNRWPEFDPIGACEAMRTLTAEEYGYYGLLRMAMRRVPLIWRLYPPTTDDRLPEDGKPIRQPFCSHAVSLATHLGGGVDPVPRRPHCRVTPTHLTESLFYNYEFSVATDWCRFEHGTIIDSMSICNEHMRAVPTKDQV